VRRAGRAGSAHAVRAQVLDRLSRGFSVARRLGPHLAGQRAGLIVAVLLGIASTGLEVLRPLPLKWIIDGALAPPTSPPPLVPPGWDARDVVLAGAAATILLLLARLACDYLGNLRIAEVGRGVTRGLRLALFRQICELSGEFRATHKAGDLLVRLMGDVPMVRTMLVDSLVLILTRAVLVIGTLGMMFYLDAELTWVCLAILPALLVIVRILSRRISVLVQKQRKKEGALADFLQESLVATEVIQSLGGTRHTVRRFAQGNRTSVRAELKAARASARLAAWVDGLLGLATSATLVLGGLRVLQDVGFTAGDLLAYLAYVRSLSKPARSSAKHMDKVAKGTACGERILDILDRSSDVVSGPRVAPESPSELAFDRVGYRYPGASADALDDVSFRVRRGELVALFGPSGAGKSTLMRLALRLFDPQRGALRLDGTSLRELRLDSLRARVGLAMQESVLFGDTIRENLLLAAPESDDEAIRAALAAVGALDFVEALPEGLDSELGGGGSGLSGGQRRRLCLARALLRRAPILLVDEPFAGLDEPTARSIEATLRTLAAGRIVIVVTHEVARLGRFDRIVFLAAGRKLAEGPHAELLERCERYAEACDLQAERRP